MQNFEYKPENKIVSVVLVGAFNPLMFQPHWFGSNDIVSPVEAESAVSNNNPCIIAPDITIFNTSQLQIQVRANIFSIMAIKESFSVVKDVVKKTFERLGAMPITAMGINTAAHFKMPNKTKYQEFGDRLSPKDIWKELLGDNVSGDDRTGGLISMTMHNGRDDPKGFLNVHVEHSARFMPGIFVSCNDHYTFDEDTDAEKVMDILEERFDVSIKKSIDIQRSLFDGL